VAHNEFSPEDFTMSTVSNSATAGLCHGTPMVAIMDNRGLSVRSLEFNRNLAGEAVRTLIARQTYTVTGQPLSHSDARMFAAQTLNPDVVPNFRYHCSLSGQVLRSQSQDAGNQVTLVDIAGSPFWQQGSRGQTMRFDYDDVHRLTTVHERDTSTEPERTSQRYVYGEGLAEAVAGNCRGQQVRSYDTAGLTEVTRFTLTGQSLHEVRQFLQDPLARSDWQGEEVQWQALLETERYSSRLGYNAQGAVLRSVDARGNQQHQSLDVAGQLASSALRLADGGAERPILVAISYSAAGQVLQEQAFNGVVTEYTYEAQTRRLSRLRTTRPVQSGRNTLLQDLSYYYDPVGNILSINDAAIQTRYHNNQRIEPVNTYGYDAVYQLLSATGRENANASQQGPGLPTPEVPIATDPNQFSQYTRLYQYDDGGNLTQMRHQGRHNYTLDMLVSPSSNRAVRKTGQLLPSEIEGHFDAGGNLIALAQGQPMSWDGRNQLQRVAQVVRPVGEDDAQYYQYDGDGTRVRKTTDSHTDTLLRRAQVFYLPGLELRRTQRLQGNSTYAEEELHVIKVSSAGRQQVRVLHWESGLPEDLPNDQLRGSLDNQLGSSLLELDPQADILTLEEYYPYGGTAVWSGKNASETKYKFVRYSGKERDATGLYYYGFRYYAAWLGRWLNPDPAGTVDGLNLYRMVGNNPINYMDPDGKNRISKEFVWSGHMKALEDASRKGNFAVSFRSAGKATLDALAKGAAAKGHDLVVEACPACLVFGNELGLEQALAITGDLQR
jgi:insecticidal toxin complex protein TccC